MNLPPFDVQLVIDRATKKFLERGCTPDEAQRLAHLFLGRLIHEAEIYIILNGGYYVQLEP